MRTLIGLSILFALSACATIENSCQQIDAQEKQACIDNSKSKNQETMNGLSRFFNSMTSTRATQ